MVTQLQRRKKQYEYEAKFLYRGFKKLYGDFYQVTIVKKADDELTLILQDVKTKQKYYGIFDTATNFFINTRGRTLIDYVVENL